MPSRPTITTERLIIRLAEPGNIPGLLRFYRENAVHLTPTSPIAPSDFLTDAFWVRQIARNDEDFAQGRSVKLFLFETSDPDIVAGQISLMIQGRWQDQILVGLTNLDWRPPD